MNVLNDTWRGLVERRLWPVALLLLAAAASIPFLIAKDDPATPASVAAPAASAETGGPAPSIVAVASTAQREIGRDVIGSRKDPFRPAVAAKKATAVETGGAGGTAIAPVTEPSSGGGGGGGEAPAPSTGGGMTPTTPGVGITPDPGKVYEIAALAVRFGETSGAREVRTLRRLKALPSVAEPVLIYLGLKRDDKTAVFMVDSGAVAHGEGHCQPSDQNCQTIQIEVGETEFIDVADGDRTVRYQLDVLKVRRKRTTSAAAARRARLATASGGKTLLRERWNRLGRWRYNESTGHVREIGDKAYAEDLARARARAAE